jgi:PAS domain S-box-containing protein
MSLQRMYALVSTAERNRAMKASDGQVLSLDAATFLSPDLRTSSVAAAIVVSTAGRIVAVNDCMLELIGRPIESLIGRSIQAELLQRPGDWETWRCVTPDQPRRGTEVKLKTSDGRTVVLRGDLRSMVHAGRQHYVKGVFVDASAAKHLEASLTHAARMEAVASLTSGVAHDFSNLLTVLVGNLYLISEGVRDRPTLHEKIRLTRDAAKRGVDLVRQLLAFARNEWVECPTIDAGKTVAKLEPLLRRSIGSRIALETNIAPDVALVEASAGQLESAIINLVINARDAIKADGRIRVSVANLAVDDRAAAAYGVRRGDYVRISVEDDGCGMPEHLLGRAFEPFFSTKGEGKGTGLGLAMVRLFAIRSSGTALIKSAPGRGTAVSMLLPRSVAVSASASATTTATMPLSALPGGKETILVFSEEEDLRHTVEQILATLGYNVIVRSDLQESLASVRTGAVHLALIDIKSASSSHGFKLLQATAKLKPKVRTVILRDAVQVHYAGIATLQKPFDLASLATTVRQTLNGGHDER